MDTKSDDGWTTIRKNGRIKPSIYPVRSFWCGFSPDGNEKWFIELNNGHIIGATEENYKYWFGIYTNR